MARYSERATYCVYLYKYTDTNVYLPSLGINMHVDTTIRCDICCLLALIVAHLSSTRFTDISIYISKHNIQTNISGNTYVGMYVFQLGLCPHLAIFQNTLWRADKLSTTPGEFQEVLPK